MSQEKKRFFTIFRIVFIGVMSAMVFVISLFRFPLFSSKMHLGNTICLLSGLLFGPVSGGLASGIGSFLVDVQGGYPLWEAIITLVSKFAMGFLAGLLGNTFRKLAKSKGLTTMWVILGSVVGSVSYVCLYMLKHFVLQLFVYQNGWDAMWAVLAAKFPASALNCVVSFIIAPVLFFALFPALKAIPSYRKQENLSK